MSGTPVPFQSGGTECNSDIWIDFWGPNDTRPWTQSSIHISYTKPANTSFLLVAYIDGQVAAESYEQDPGEHDIHFDGARISLQREYTGRHAVQVVVYHDENQNSEFDRGTDTPCLVDGDIAQAGPTWVNFSQFE